MYSQSNWNKHIFIASCPLDEVTSLAQGAKEVAALSLPPADLCKRLLQERLGGSEDQRAGLLTTTRAVLEEVNHLLGNHESFTSFRRMSHGAEQMITAAVEIINNFM